MKIKDEICGQGMKIMISLIIYINKKSDYFCYIAKTINKLYIYEKN